MNDKSKIKETIGEFCSRLDKDRLNYFAKKEHGFEAWLKFEMAYWLKAKPGGKDTVELELNLPLIDDADKKSKFVDVEFHDEEGLHLIELKVVFEDWNKPKMAQSAGWDLWYLQRTEGRFASRGVLVFVVSSKKSNRVEEGDLKNHVFEAVEVAVKPDKAFREDYAISDNITALYIRTAIDDKSRRDPNEETITGKSPSGVDREITVNRVGEKNEDLSLWIHSPGGSGYEIVMDKNEEKDLKDAL